MKENETLKRVTELTSRLLDETLQPGDAAELNELLRGNPDACELYLQLSGTHATLLFENSELEGFEPPARVIEFPGTAKKKKRNASSKHWLGWAALFLILLNVALLSRSQFETSEEPSTQGDRIAVVSSLVSPEWGDIRNEPKEGDALSPGLFHLKSGLAHLEFFSGASVVVEGPAELNLQSAWKMHCHEGRLRTFVPEPARGFTITTPDYDAVDLGTEFLLNVNANGDSELHVVDGAVKVNDKGGSELALLETGHGVRSDAGKIEPAGKTPDGNFVGRETILGLAQEEWQSRYEAWCTVSERLQNDASALAVFDFENHKPWDRQLTNRTTSGPNGAIIGAQWTRGRFPAKGALEFKRITDRVRIHIPGEFDEITFAARVRIESFDRWLSSLLLTDGFETGELHWQISDKGELILGIQTGRKNPNSFSEQVIFPSDLGRWIHLAVTVNRTTGKVAHYLDGEVVAIDYREGLPPLRIGNAEIGNWNPANSKGTAPLRSLNGKMEEFVILQREMQAEEIRELERSNPK